jgi:PAS domain S-box-containing protein
MFIDKDKNHWIFSHNSISLYRPQHDNFKVYPIDMTSDKVKVLPLKEYFECLQRFSFRLPFNDRNINHYDSKNDEFYEIRPDLPLYKDYKIPFVFNKDSNTIWIFLSTDEDSYIYSYNYQTEQSDVIPTKIPHIVGAFKDSYGNIWIGSWLNGIWLYNPETNKVEKFHLKDKVLDKAISDKIVFEIIEDRYNNIWFPVWGVGLVRYNPISKQPKLFSQIEGDENSFSSNVVQNLMISKEGLIWAGTLSKGVNYFDPNMQDIKHIKKKQKSTSLSNNSVYALLEDSERNIWIGTDGGGLDIFKNSVKIKNFNKNNGLSSNTVISFYEDKFNDVWIGNWFGYLQKYNKKTKKLITYDGKREKKCHERTARAITAFDENEVIICGEFDGVTSYKFEENEFHVWQDQNGKRIRDHIGTVFAITRDPNGKYWIGGDGGLLIFDRETKTIEYPKLPNGKITKPFFVWNLHYDIDQDCILIGTNGMGLKKANYKNNTIKAFPFLNSLSSEVIYGILKKNKSEFWLSTVSGIYAVDFERENFINFDGSNGLQDTEFTQGAYAKLMDNRMMFGGQNGFNIIVPDKMTIDTTPPEIVFTNFKMDNKRVFIDDYSKTLEIPFANNDISIDYSAFDFTYFNKVKFKYILKNYDDEWESVNYNQRNARYTNLPSGHYEFVVKAANSDGIWNDIGKSIKIHIQKPYWEKWWFRGVVVLFVFLIVYLIYYIRMRYIIRKNKELQRIINENIANIEMQKQKLEGIFNNAIAGIIITNPKLEILFANKYFENLVDIKIENNKSLNLSQFISTADSEKIKLKYEVIDHKDVSDFYTTIKIRNSRDVAIWIGLSCSKILEDDVEQYLFVLIDINEQKHSESKILELERKSSALAMAVTANHELNQPLMVVQGNIEMLLFEIEDKLTENQKKKIVRILSSVSDMTKILNKYKQIKDLTFNSYIDETDMVTFDQE